MAKLRAGVVGLGIMGRNHARVLSSLDGVDLVGIVEPNFSNNDFSKVAPVFFEIKDLIAQGLDYCLIAVPTALHEEIGSQLAEAGVPCLIEKPLAHNLTSAQKLMNWFKDANLLAAVGHIERYNPALQEARKRIINGDLGKLYQVATSRQGPFPKRIQDVGVVKDLATHDIDLTSWITGSSYKSVSARTTNRTGRSHEDLVNIVGELNDGTITSHNVNWLSPLKERKTFILGERGAFIADTLTADLTFYSNGTILNEWDEMAKFRGVSEGDVTRFAFAKPEPLRTQHENFRDAVLGISADFATLEQGLLNVKVAEAVLLSSKSNSVIEIK
jgi:UDP-N-acetylglucosamine 3-dehydrogenase